MKTFNLVQVQGGRSRPGGINYRNTLSISMIALKVSAALGRDFLKRFGGLGGLLNADKEDLERIKGLGIAKIAQLLAATEIAKRQLKEEIVGKPLIKGPEDVIEYLSVSMSNLKKEIFQVIYLNTANVVLAAEDLFKGTIDQSAVYPRDVIKRALELNASGSSLSTITHPAI